MLVCQLWTPEVGKLRFAGNLRPTLLGPLVMTKRHLAGVPSARTSTIGGYLRIRSDPPSRRSVEALPDDQVLVVKTHSPLSADVRSFLPKGWFGRAATFRDPRDCRCRGADAAAWKSLNAQTEPFATSARWQTRSIYRRSSSASQPWLANPRVLKMPFDLLATDPCGCTQRLASSRRRVDAVRSIGPT